ncbi:MAG: stage V sporulation protein AD [Clostridiales bacterium]|nr:stage V sporulation protein AD [Clostridiales bacterium]
MLGKQSVQFDNQVYIISSGSIVGSKEGQGPMGKLFDKVGWDDMFGASTWEEAESSLQREALQIMLDKACLKKEDIQLIFAGDLLGQSIASSFGMASFNTPHVGMYGACSTCGLTIAIGSLAVAGGFVEKAACVTSSHFASAEKEFRYPLGYGNQRPLSASWTVTGSAAFLLSHGAKEKARAKVAGATFGRIMDYGIKDSMNMGACMAPAAADTIKRNLQDFGRTPADYDKIITGDLGSVGQKLLFELLEAEGIDICKQHMDCGIEIFDSEKQNTNAGGSGCGCAAVTLSAYILKKIEEGTWKRVLFAPTGALLSKTSFNEGQTIPGIAHGVILEGVN